MKNQIIKILKTGGVSVLLTDTLYGLVGQALSKKTVARIYKIKGRNSNKPLIILVSSVNDLSFFGIKIDNQTRDALENFWPGPVSAILPCPLKKFEYLHRGTKTLAFRFPKKKSLIGIIEKTGPLVAPSANLEGMPPAKNITEAKGYFGCDIDFYSRGVRPAKKPSIIIKISNGRIEIIRK